MFFEPIVRPNRQDYPQPKPGSPVPRLKCARNIFSASRRRRTHDQAVQNRYPRRAGRRHRAALFNDARGRLLIAGVDLDDDGPHTVAELRVMDRSGRRRWRVRLWPCRTFPTPTARDMPFFVTGFSSWRHSAPACQTSPMSGRRKRSMGIMRRESKKRCAQKTILNLVIF